MDGSDAHAITFGPGDFQVETVLKNGMILATARSPLLPSNGLPADRELYTLRPDGTGSGNTALRSSAPRHSQPSARTRRRRGGLREGFAHQRNLGGDLAWIRRGALHNRPLTAPPILASSPQPIAADELLVARESSTGPATGKKLTLYAFDAAWAIRRTLFTRTRRLSTVEAVPVAAHEPPRWYWSTLNPELQRGYFVCLDSHLAEGVPHGTDRDKAHASSRADARCRHPKGNRLLGEAPIEEDGSFYIAVPPDQPVRFEVLDAAGHVVRAQRSWIWSRSGEEHGCVGCHEDRALAPENRWPMALRRFDTPTRLDLAKP